MAVEFARTVAEHFLETAVATLDHAIAGIADADEGVVEDELVFGQALGRTG